MPVYLRDGSAQAILRAATPEIEVADQTFHLTLSRYTDTGPTSPSTDPISPGAWQGSHWSANFEVTGMTRPRKNLGASGIRTPGSAQAILRPATLRQKLQTKLSISPSHWYDSTPEKRSWWLSLPPPHGELLAKIFLRLFVPHHGSCLNTKGCKPFAA